MDKEQLLYQRLFNYPYDELIYKNYIIRGKINNNIKREIVLACCSEHARHLQIVKKFDKVLSIKKE